MTPEPESIHQQFTQVYKAVSPRKQALMLLSLAHNLTIGARESYPLATEGLTENERFTILHDFNELQHRIVSHSTSLLIEDERRYPDEVIFGMLQPDVQDNEIVSKSLSWALGQSVKFIKNLDQPG